MPDLPLKTIAIAKSIAINNMATTLAAVTLTREELRQIAATLREHAAELREAALRESYDKES